MNQIAKGNEDGKTARKVKYLQDQCINYPCPEDKHGKPVRCDECSLVRESEETLGINVLNI